MFGFKRAARNKGHVTVYTSYIGGYLYAGPWCGFEIVCSNKLCVDRGRAFYLTKDGVTVAKGSGNPNADNLTTFVVPGSESLLRAVLDFMVAEHRRSIEASRLGQLNHKRVAAAAALGITLEEK